MNVKSQKKSNFLFARLLVIMLLSLAISCSTDTINLEDMSVAPENEKEIEGEETSQPCTNSSDFVFNEKDGLVIVEFEETEFSGDWKQKSGGSGFSGKGYMIWEGAQHLGSPGNGVATFKIKIETSGTYQFMWNSAVKMGNSGSDHNDTWLRFNDADDFYAQKETSKVYPKDTGKTPNPEGASKDGWFKIYRSGNDLNFKWQSSTFDNNGHDIFVLFENPGIYLMEVSARSSGHAIDKFVLFNDSYSKADAIADGNLTSEITCD